VTTPLHICNSEDISDNRCFEFTFRGKPCFLVRHDGCVFGYINACPHLNIELNWQENAFLDTDNALIQCATHGALFMIDNGDCVSGPCAGQSLSALTVTEKDNKIFVSQ